MDPGTIVSIVELSTSVLKLGYKVHLEFFGHETSVGKLQHFNGRLQLINDALEDIVEDSKTGATHSTESFKGIPQLQATLQEGKDFLSRFDKTLGGRSKTQRIQFITGVGEKELDNLNAKVDRHYQELQYWSSRNISRQFRTWHQSVSTPAAIGEQTGDYVATHRPQGSQLGTKLNTGTHTSILDRGSSVSPRGSRSPRLRSSSRPPSLSAVSEDSRQELPADRDNSHTDHYGYDIQTAQRHMAGYTHRSTDLHVSSTRPSYANSVESTIAVSSAATSPQGTQRPPSFTAINLHCPASFTENGQVVLTLGKRIWVFHPASAKILEANGTKAVEWVNQTTKILHYIPTTIPRIPHTKPNDKDFQIFFLPLSTTHVFQITEKESCTELRDVPRYKFNHKTDREVFQRKFRGRQFLEMIQALVVRSVSGRHIAKDVHLKVWSRGDGDETPTFSFAHHGLNEVNHQEEYTIRWFKETPELRDPAKLILRAYSMETDLNYGQRPEQLPRRSSTFGSIFRRPSDNANTSRPPSISMSTQSLYETKGIPPPPAVQRLGGIEIEFQSSSLRDKFLKACQEAHHGMRTSRRSTVIYDGLPSPDLRSQPPNFNLSHNNELTGSSVTRVYELPSYQSPVELPTNGNIHEMPASYSPQEMPRFSIPRYTPSDLMPEVAQFSSRPQALEYSSGVMSYAGNSTIHREP